MPCSVTETLDGFQIMMIRTHPERCTILTAGNLINWKIREVYDPDTPVYFTGFKFFL